MARVDDIADGLAQRVMEIVLRTGDEEIENRIGQELGASSPTLQEAFLTSMRIRKAEQRGLALLDKYDKGDVIPVAQISSQPQD